MPTLVRNDSGSRHAFRPSLAMGICAGWLLVFIIPADVLAGVDGLETRQGGSITHSVVKVAVLAAGFVTLGRVLALAEAARRMVGSRRGRSRAQKGLHARSVHHA